MARFNLNKGDRFKLSKDELSLLRVELEWNSEADLDAEAFCLDANDQIVDDADFVYYNSENRAVAQEEGESDADYMARLTVAPYDRNIYGAKKNWRNSTVPYSTDGSVIGSWDDPGSEGGDEENGETLRVDLGKVRPEIRRIIFCVTIHTPGLTFRDVPDASITIINAETDEELCHYQVAERFTTEDAMVAGAVVLNEDGEWEFEAIGEGYDGGLQTLVDMYA